MFRLFIINVVSTCFRIQIILFELYILNIPLFLLCMVSYCVSCNRPQQLNLRCLSFYAFQLQFIAYIHIGALGPKLYYLTATEFSFYLF